MSRARGPKTATSGESSPQDKARSGDNAIPDAPGVTGSDRGSDNDNDHDHASGTASGSASGREVHSGSFEEELAVVENVVERMERGELSLEDCLLEYERGLRSLKNCYYILERAQKRIEILEGQVGSIAQGEEGLVWKPASHFSNPLGGRLASLSSEGKEDRDRLPHPSRPLGPEEPPGASSPSDPREVEGG